MKLLSAIYNNIQFPLLIVVILIGIWLRWFTAGFDVILDFDPWWFFRHAETLYENDFTPPKWDIQSYYPPGRPVDYYLGWSYTLAGAYALVQNFVDITLMKFSGLFVAIFAALSAIPAYFVGRHVTNRWGGLFTALFAIATPTFLAVSMAGYPDSDATDVFYTFLAVITTLLAIKKSKVLNFTNFAEFRKTLMKFVPYSVPALIAYWLFAFNWSSSWYIYYIFVLFVPLLVIARVVESFVSRQAKLGLPLIVSKIRENKGLIFAILFIGFVGEAISLLTYTWPFNTIPPHEQLIQGLNLLGTQGLEVAAFIAFLLLYGGMVGVAFGRMRGTVIGALIGVFIGIALMLSGITGASLIVNISVAELQVLNVFSAEGFQQIVGRIGIVPVVLAFTAFLITALKIIYRKEIHFAEYFAIMWMILSLFLITQGIRFSLLFSMATATAAGFTVGNLIEFVRRRESQILFSTFAAIFVFVAILHISSTAQFAQTVTGGLEVSDNWKAALTWLKENADEDALITTWWDPGHIITGFTGLKVHADGAHCGAFSCKPYDHNIRIQDMGRVFATSDKQEALHILNKYMNRDGTLCNDAKEEFGEIVPEEACKPVSEMYVIASSDLIGKYFWLSFFGTGTGNNFVQLSLSGQDEQGNLIYGGGLVTLAAIEDNRLVALINAPQQGVRNSVVSDVVAYQNGQELRYNYANFTNKVEGMLWVDPSFSTVIFMNPPIRDSIFTKLFFFNGRGLEDSFELVFANPELKVYRVKFDPIL